VKMPAGVVHASEDIWGEDAAAFRAIDSWTRD
jgi:hypothetical protein